MPNTSIDNAYRYCQQLASQHYENFPVASVLLPSHLRKPISAIYAFARQADDFADEGDFSSEQRLALLTEHGQALDNALLGEPTDDPVFIACADSIQQYHLTTSLFHDLLTAFKQDIEKKSYPLFTEILDYCRYSANPVGRLLLQLQNIRDEHAYEISDSVCSALQLINFYQDLAQDFDENQRIYLAEDEMRQAGVSLEDIKNRCSNEAMQKFMYTQYQRAEDMLIAGKQLPKLIGGRLGIEIRLTLLTAQRIVKRLKQQQNVFARPRLRKRDWAIVFFQLITMRLPH